MMKKQLFKRLLVLGFALLSISGSFVQCKPNQVLVCHINRATGYLVCKCVPKTHVKTYMQNGCTISYSAVVSKKDQTIEGKNLEASTGSNFLPSTNKAIGSQKKI
jgi:hypothetical protein